MEENFITYISIDVGGTFIKYTKMDVQGNVSQVKKKPTPKSLDHLLTAIFESIDSYLEPIAGIGISCPGKVDVEKGIVFHGGSLPYLDKVPLKQIIQDKYGVPCAVSNDGKAAALAEVWKGNLKGVDNGAVILLGTGVGGGIIVEGKLLQGSHFQAGELSFLLRSPDQAYLENIIGFSASAVEFIQQASKIIGLTEQNDGEKIFEIITTRENRKLDQLFKKYCQEIAFIIINLQATLDSSKILIGGGISAQKILIEEIKQQYSAIRSVSEVMKNSFVPIAIESCAFQSNSNLLGAVYQLFLQTEKESK